MEELKAMSQSNPNKRILSIQFFASHGYVIYGTQRIVANHFHEETKFYELINPESSIREMAEKMPNVYFLALFACCREGKVKGKGLGNPKPTPLATS
jgi:hypothetical protein